MKKKFVLFVLILLVSKINAGSLFWSTTFGGKDADRVKKVCVDDQGNKFVVGFTQSGKFTDSSFVYLSPHNSNHYLFAAKFSAAGDLLWCNYYQGTILGEPNSICLDGNGDLFFSTTGGHIFKCTNTAILPFASYPFLLKIAFHKGELYVLTTKMLKKGSQIIDLVVMQPSDVKDKMKAVDFAWNSNDEIYVLSYFEDSGFSTGAGKAITKFKNGAYNDSTTNKVNWPDDYGDAFISKYSAQGGLLWSSFFGGRWRDLPKCIAINKKNNEVFIMGGTRTESYILNPVNNFPVKNLAGAFNKDFNIVPQFSSDVTDVFLACFNQNDSLIWSTSFAGDNNEYIEDIALSESGDLYFTGYMSTYRPQSTYTYSPPTPQKYNLPMAHGVGDFRSFIGYNQVLFVGCFSADKKLVWNTFFEEKPRGYSDGYAQTSFGICTHKNELYLVGETNMDYLNFKVMTPGNNHGAYIPNYKTDIPLAYGLNYVKNSQKPASRPGDGGNGFANPRAMDGFIAMFKKPTKTFYDTIHLCENDSILIDGIYRKTAGTFQNITSVAKYIGVTGYPDGNSSGVAMKYDSYDSISNVFLKLTRASRVNTSLTISAGDSVLFNNIFIKTEGTYIDTLKSVFGCDSIVTLKLSLINSDCARREDLSFNNTIATASSLPIGVSIYAKIEVKNDVDFYKFDLTNTTTMRLELNNLPKNYNLKLYKNTTQLAVSGLSGLSNEVIQKTLTAGVYYVKIYPSSQNQFDNSNCYSLIIYPKLGRQEDEPFEEQVNVLEYSIFPNPANEKLLIQLPKNESVAAIEMYNSLGQLVNKFDMIGSTFEINTNNLKNDLYILRIINNNEVYTEKIIIQH